MKCRVCGTYIVSGTAEEMLAGDAYPADRWKLIGAVRNAFLDGAVPRLTTHSISSYIAIATPPRDPLELIDRIVLWLATRRGHDPGVDTQQLVHLGDFAQFYLRSEESFFRALMLVAEAGYIRPLPGLNASGGVWPPVQISLTLSGWRRVAEARSLAPESWRAFIAMWFDPSVAAAYSEGIAPALRATGYEPVRVDAVQHNDKIDDRIVAEIRRSGLVVADFTGHRGGVYFEAGFARGLGIHVIWTCHEDAIGEAHFDTRQFNHVTWSDPSDLRTRLTTRIEATRPTRAPLPEVAE